MGKEDKRLDYRYLNKLKENKKYMNWSMVFKVRILLIILAILLIFLGIDSIMRNSWFGLLELSLGIIIAIFTMIGKTILRGV